jgi:hypothetical protein
MPTVDQVIFATYAGALYLVDAQIIESPMPLSAYVVMVLSAGLVSGMTWFTKLQASLPKWVDAQVFLISLLYAVMWSAGGELRNITPMGVVSTSTLYSFGMGYAAITAVSWLLSNL